MTTAVTCLDVRRLMGAEPQRRDPAVAEHLRGCAACAAFVRDMQALDLRLERAFKVEVPEGLEARIVLDATLKHGRRAWQPWLAAAVVGHIENPEEADALAPDRSLIHDASLVEGAMSGAGVSLDGGMSDVTYAHTCLFRGERVVHLVVHGDHGPVTILLLPRIHVDQDTPVDEGGFHGVIVPEGRGSIAIVTNNATPVEPMEQELTSSGRFTL
ncbi:MAG TPA: DUF3379 family protein [Gammaproteobacteria bacterium]|nr:DUF3379 family protein [Gammaproteobacteria bacterium]